MICIRNNTERPIGVIQILMKNRLKISDNKLDDVFDEHIKNTDDLETNINKFGAFVANSYSVIEIKIKRASKIVNPISTIIM